MAPVAARSVWPKAPARALFSREQRPVREEDGVVTAFRDGQVTLRSKRRQDGFTNAIEETGYQGVRAGDLVIHSMDGFAGAIGVSDSDGKASPVVHCYRSSAGVDVRYYAYLLRDLAIRGYITSLAKGIRERSTAFDGETFRSLVLPVPTLNEQRAIADYLDTETARIDALIAKKQRMIELLQERWRAAASHHMADLAQQCGTVQLRHLVRCLDGRRVPLSTEERSEREGQYPYYGASGVVDYVDDYLFDETLVLLGEDGAQLGVAHYPIAQIVEGRVWVNNHAHVLRPSASDAAFLVLHLNTFDRVPFISGGTREKITQDDMNRIPVPNLSVARQREEASQLTAMRTRCDSACRVLEKQIGLLREHRQALITATVTGEFEVPGVAA